MNTRGIKFLAVLAVLAMAFAAFAVIEPAEENDAGTATGVTELVNGGTTGAAGAGATLKYFVDLTTENVGVTLNAAAGTNANETYEFYVYQTETTYGLTITAATGSQAYDANIVIYVATADIDTGSVTFDDTKQMYFIKQKTDAGTGTIVVVGKYANSAATLYMTAVPDTNPFQVISAYATNGASHFDVVMANTTVALNGDANYTTLTIPAGNIGKYTVTGAVSTAAPEVVTTTEINVTNADVLTATADNTGKITVAATEAYIGVKTTVAAGTYLSEFTGATATIKNNDLTAAPTAGTLKFIGGTFVTSGALDGAAGTLHIGADAVFKLAGNYTMAGNGVLTVEGSLTSTTTDNRTISGAAGSFLKVVPGSSIDYDNIILTIALSSAGMSVLDAASGDYEIKGTLQANTTLTSATLASDLIIPEGMTLEVNGMLAMGFNSITVEGTLKVGTAGIIGSNSDGTAAIFVSADGVIDNNGTIGKNFPVTVVAASNVASFVSIQAVTGVDIDQFVIDKKPYIAVSGMITKQESIIKAIEDDKDSHVLYAENVYVNDQLTITDGVFLDSVATDPLRVMDGVNVTINSGGSLGTYDGGTTSSIELMNGSSITVNGFFFGTIISQTAGEIAAGDVNAPVAGRTVIEATQGGNGYDHKTITGFAVEVDRVKYTDSSSNVKYSQRAYIYGALAVTSGIIGPGAPDAGDTAGIELGTATGTDIPVFVSDDSALLLGEKTGVTYKATGYLLVQGMVTGLAPTAKVIGASYQVTEATTPVDYITDFESAILLIDLTVSKTVKLWGPDADTQDNVKNGDAYYTLKTELDIENGWTVTLGTGSASFLKIGSDAVVTVEKGGNLNSAVIKELNGQLIVMNGGACSPAANTYEVSSVDADNNKTYSSLATVLKDAKAGDEITIAKDLGSNKTKLTIEDGVTLKVPKALTLFELNVKEGGKVLVTSAGSITTINSTTADPVITVAGTLDVSAGGFVVTAAAHATKVTSTGEFIYTAAQKTAAIDPAKAAVFVGAEFENKAGNLVLTTTSNAIASGADNVEINEKYTSSEDLYLSEGQTLTIADGVEVTVKSIDVVDATLVSGVGSKLNATVIGVAGVDGAEGVQISVSGFTGTITNASTINDKGETVYKFTNSAAATGTITVNAGTFTTGAAITGVATQTFTLGKDAKLQVDVNPAFGGYGKVVLAGEVTGKKDIGFTSAVPVEISGTLTMKGAGVFTVNNALTVSGTLTLVANSQAGLAGKDVLLTGTIVIPEDKTLTIVGDMIVGAPALGAAPEIDGIITIGADAYVVSYASIKSNFAEAVKETKLVINGSEYAFAYTNDGEASDIEDLITNRAVKLEIPGYNTSTIRTITGEFTAWKDINGDLIDKDTLLSNIAVMSYTAAVSQVNIKVSWATGTSIYIDGIRMVDTEYTLDVGKHTVTFNTNPGYKGTDMKVTYKGATVTDSFTVAVGDDNAILAGVGNISVDAGEAPEPTPAEKEAFGITEILLVVLVILIAVMVIIVLLRMNRS